MSKHISNFQCKNIKMWCYQRRETLPFFLGAICSMVEAPVITFGCEFFEVKNVSVQKWQIK